MPMINGQYQHWDRCLVVWHDNHNPKNRKNCGYTEHSISEVWYKGGVNAILKEYRDAGIYVEKMGNGIIYKLFLYPCKGTI